jgi:acetylglutamate kinase
MAAMLIETDPSTQDDRTWATARTLAEALPFIQIYDRETVVVKYGGHAMGEGQAAALFAADIVMLKLLGTAPVVVHGGGPMISAMLDKAGVNSHFVSGLRVTDHATMEIAEMVLSGAVNKELANAITLAGAEADVRGVGLSGKDARLITVTKATRTTKDPLSKLEQVVDLGFVGEPSKIDPRLIDTLIHDPEHDYVPVIAPIGVSKEGETYNINADTAAGAIAAAEKIGATAIRCDVSNTDDVEAAVAAGQPQAEIDQLQATADAITEQRASLFEGETLRGLLLSAYAWSTVGMIAGIAAIGAFIAAAITAVLVALGIVHHRRLATSS